MKLAKIDRNAINILLVLNKDSKKTTNATNKIGVINNQLNVNDNIIRNKLPNKNTVGNV